MDLRHDPLHEETYRHLMRLYAVRGDRASALRMFHTCATILERELGTAPSEATREMYGRLMQTDASSSKRGARPSAHGTAAPLVGREREWAQLLGEWRTSIGVSPRMVVISGEAGIGKTRLAEELLSWVSRQGVTTASARCYEALGALAYAPVTAWLQADAVQPHLFTLPDIWLTEVARLVPELLSACQAALAASVESGIAGEIGSARCWLGFAQLMHSDLEAAEEQLQAALHIGEQIGDVTLQVRCLLFLTITLRRRGQVEAVRRLSERALAQASAIQAPDYLLHFLASLSWVAWRQGDLAEAKKQAQAALEMGQPLHLFFFQWTTLLPLLGVALAEARDADAVTYGRLLLSPTQQRLPDALTTVLEAAVLTWDADQPEAARSHLQQAIALAMELGYL